MLFARSRSLEPLPELLRGRGWCHLKARVLLFNPGYHTARLALCDAGLPHECLHPVYPVWVDQAANKQTAAATAPLKTRHDAQTNKGR